MSPSTPRSQSILPCKEGHRMDWPSRESTQLGTPEVHTQRRGLVGGNVKEPRAPHSGQLQSPFRPTGRGHRTALVVQW